MTDQAAYEQGCEWAGLNAPFGARCFMTGKSSTGALFNVFVLMHRLAPGAL